MGAGLRSWWQKIRKPLEVFCIIVLCILVIVLLVVIAMAYLFNVNVPGLHGKTLWDWMQLLFIPVVLAAAGFWFNHRERKAAELRAAAEREIEQQRAKAEQEISSDNQQEAALQAYLNEMSELLLHENLRKSEPGDEVRKIARVRTLTVLPRLDPKRKGNVLLFLAESDLIGHDPIIDLTRADLSGVQLYKPWLNEVNLQETNLSEADLYEADLLGANLRKADLYKAHLAWATLHGVNLREANLSRADLHKAELGEADLSEADLSEADLQSANLENADLSRAIVRSANLSEAKLRKANLQGAMLINANLHGANLAGADLSETDLYSANISSEQWEKAKSLRGATMPDGSVHP